MTKPVKNKVGQVLTNDDGEPILPAEAMVMSLMTSAMQGDQQAIVLIHNLVKKPDTPEDVRHRKEQEQQLLINEQSIRDQLTVDGIYDKTMQFEIERLANTLLVIQRLEAQMRERDHEDVTAEVNRTGQTTMRLSVIDDIRQKQLKQFNDDLMQLRNTAQVRAQIRKRNSKRQ